MPQNKRESLIYTVIMCFFMVLWMGTYNVILQYGTFSAQAAIAAWVGFPFAYVFAMLCDLFIVSKLAKGAAFRWFLKPEDRPLKKIIFISLFMAVQMVIIMSLYGAFEGALHTGMWSQIPKTWLINIPRNFIMAIPLQLLVAGPLVRRLFRALFPVGSVLG